MHLKRYIKEGRIIVHHFFAYRLITQVTWEATMGFAVENKPGTVGHLRMQRDKTPPARPRVAGLEN